jgi:hypothetical protein
MVQVIERASKSIQKGRTYFAQRCVCIVVVSWQSILLLILTSESFNLCIYGLAAFVVEALSSEVEALAAPLVVGLMQELSMDIKSI